MKLPIYFRQLRRILGIVNCEFTSFSLPISPLEPATGHAVPTRRARSVKRGYFDQADHASRASLLLVRALRQAALWLACADTGNPVDACIEAGSRRGRAVTPNTHFTPAAGRFVPTALYDLGVALLTRESTWRAQLLARLAPAPGEAILDVGCGTGSLAILLKQAEPDARITGLDPDPKALNIARRKADAAGVTIEWQQGFARDASNFGTFDKVVSSLVFHQVPVAEKREGLAAMFAATKIGGLVCIGDYSRQNQPLMRQLFRIVQLIDGRTNTQPNADGFLENEIARILGRDVMPDYAINTPTGTISLFCEARNTGDTIGK